MLFGLGVCLALPGALPALAQEHREQPASGERTAVWATLTADEQESYGAAEHERKARREQRRAERRAGRSDGLLIPGDTCPEAVGGHILLPAIEAGSTTGQLDDYTYGAACGGFNASSGVGPDLAYLIVTMVTCDLEVELDPVACGLWPVELQRFRVD